jgi:peptidyl-prolyl cis-trans isomerase C
LRPAARGAGRKQFADNIVKILVLSQEGKRRKLNENPAFQTQSMFLLANTLAGLTYQQISKDVPVDEAAVRKIYEDRKAEYEQVHARHILIRMQGSPTPVRPGQKDFTEEEALAKANELRKKILGGADFAALATAESDDSVSAVKGGDLGTFTRGQMVPSFDEAAFTLKPGELSEPVKSQRGYHLIRVESHNFKSFEEMRPELERGMRPALAQKALEDLQKKAATVFDPEFFNMAKQ